MMQLRIEGGIYMDRTIWLVVPSDGKSRLIEAPHIAEAAARSFTDGVTSGNLFQITDEEGRLANGVTVKLNGAVVKVWSG